MVCDNHAVPAGSPGAVVPSAPVPHAAVPV